MAAEHVLQGSDQDGRLVRVDAAWVIGIGRVKDWDLTYVQLIDCRCVTICEAFEDVLEFIKSAPVSVH